MECMATGQNVNFTDYGHTGQERRHFKAKIICSVAKIAGCMHAQDCDHGQENKEAESRLGRW